MISRRTLLMAGASTAIWAPLVRAQAEDYPARPVKIICGYAAGGPTDAVARMVAELLGKQLGQSFVVENRLGASGVLAGRYLKTLPPDGYNLLMAGSGAMVIATNLNDNIGYDSLRDFTPLSPVSDFPYLLVVPGSAPYGSIADLVREGRSPSAKLSFASAGVGSPNHLAGEWFKSATRIEAVHAPYKGDSDALADVVAGRISFAFLASQVVAPHVRSGALRVLGVSSLKTGRAGDGIPRIADAGIPDFAVEPWTGMFGPAGMPAPLVQKLSEALRVVLASPAARDRLASVGQFPKPGTPEELREFMRSEQQRWGRLIKAAGIPKITG